MTEQLNNCSPCDHGTEALSRTKWREVETGTEISEKEGSPQSLPLRSSPSLYFPKCLVSAAHVIAYLLFAATANILVLTVLMKHSTSNRSCHGKMATQIILRLDYYPELSKSMALKKYDEKEVSLGSSGTEESACNAGDPGSIPGSGRSPGGGNGSPLQYCCLENSMDRGAGQATVCGITELDLTL